jgi:hypothetical protein
MFPVEVLWKVAKWSCPVPGVARKLLSLIWAFPSSGTRHEFSSEKNITRAGFFTWDSFRTLSMLVRYCWGTARAAQENSWRGLNLLNSELDLIEKNLIC